MAKTKRRVHIITGLLRLGYVRRDTATSTYAEFTPGLNAQALFDGPHRILVGRDRKVRYTRGTIADSHGLAQNMVDRILEAQ